MDYACSNSAYHRANIQSILTLVYLFFFLNHFAFSVAESSISSLQKIFVACGSSGSLASHGRRWIGDVDSQYSPTFEPQNNASTGSAPLNQARNPEDYYKKARLSSSPFTYLFNVTSGQKFIRLHFYPASYPGFDSSKAFFSVKAGSFTLLTNFSASLTANHSREDVVLKEYCVNVEEGQRLNITFTPSSDYKQAYAFINGIEIVSMPTNLYYTGADNMPLKFLAQVSDTTYSIENSSALETVYRINIGGSPISPQYDTGLYRTWFDGKDYLTDARPGAYPYTSNLSLNFSGIRSYTAPLQVYTTAMSMGGDKKTNENYSLTWEFPVDSGFTYFVRLHFCEFEKEITTEWDRVFEINIANLSAETQADVIAWSGGPRIPYYRDYAVIIASKGNEKEQPLSIAMHPNPNWKTRRSDAILNGVEIFKVDNNGNLSGPNPDPVFLTPSIPERNPPTEPKKDSATIISIIAGVVSGFVVLFLLFLIIFRRARKVKDSGSSTGASFWVTFSPSTTKSTKSRGSSLPSDLCTHFSLSEIKAATNDFDDVFIIGVGGFGNVYKGYVDDGSTPVAIKRLNPGSQQGVQEFNTEIEMLSRLRHRHLVSLIGYCNDHGEMILVYDYMSRGTLHPEYYRLQHLTEKSDVYSFGVVLFEVLCARPPILRTGDKKQVSLAFWAQQSYRNGTLDQIIDPFLKGKIAPECLNKFAEVAMSCLDDNGMRRPSMSEVVWGLEFALQLQETAEKNEKFGDDDQDGRKGGVDYDENPLMKYESDVDSGVLFSRIGGHVLESKSISTATPTTSDDQSLTTKSSDSRNVSGAVFSEIMNPQGR
ncbi:hypothetical protein Patl1_21677 [Pistacia atlantica]|uniref:Uncharacterized protein n=1 Tax=Pistacia atlantica TaxID=434234 RepID=A0ACC1BP13_9ROSI|nr:hypothetical protein Patl1_21677 [Pistacia atlantica]